MSRPDLHLGGEAHLLRFGGGHVPCLLMIERAHDGRPTLIATCFDLALRLIVDKGRGSGASRNDARLSRKRSSISCWMR